MFWAAAFAPRFVGVGHRDDGLNRRTGGDARSNSSALCGLRRRPRTMGFNRPSVLDRHGCGVGPGGGRGDRTRSLPPLLANTPVPGSHYRIAFSPSREAIESASLLHYGDGYDFVRAGFGSGSRGRDSQCNSVRRDWSPDVGHRRGYLVPRLKLSLSRLSNDEKARRKPCTSRLGMQPAPRVFSSNARADISVEQRIRALPVVTRATGKNTEPDHRPNLPFFCPAYFC